MPAPMMNAAEIELARRLSRARWFAGGLLAVMAAVFIATSLVVDEAPALGIVLAFSEAALIGGLADWFAVTALFRRPLGLPIPHTAIVPSRKKAIGQALARFVAEHFLVREAVEKRLEKTDPALRVGGWLEREENAKLMSRDIGIALDWLLESADSAELRTAMRTGLAGMLERVPITGALAALVDVLATGNNAQALIDQLVEFGRDQLERNKATIRARIEDRSPWWLPKFVDEEIYDQIVAEFERLLGEIGSDPEHPAREEFNRRLAGIRRALAEDPALQDRAGTLRDEFTGHPAVQQYFQDVWDRLREYLHATLSNPDSELRLALEREISRIGKQLHEDERARAHLNAWLKGVFVYIVDNYRDSLSEVISDTIDEWDAESTSRRIELNIGKDLQFIRVNGTIVGGLVGVAIYLVWNAIGL